MNSRELNFLITEAKKWTKKFSNQKLISKSSFVKAKRSYVKSSIVKSSVVLLSPSYLQSSKDLKGITLEFLSYRGVSWCDNDTFISSQN